MSKNFTSLTTGCLSQILNGVDVKTPIYLQVLSSKKIPAAAIAQQRYRLVVTDGRDLHGFAMLSVPLNNYYESGQLSDFSIIRVNRYIPSKVNRNDNNEKQILILFDIEPVHLGEDVGKQIVVDESKQQKENVGTNSRLFSAAPTPQPQQRSANASMNNSSFNTSTTGDLSEHLTMPIDSLSPYANKWVIKARVVSKSAIRTWKNAKGEGKLFSMDLCDETGEIRCTGFGNMVDRYYEMIEIDKVYFISRCQLKPANKQYSKLNNEYEMTMISETQIQACTEDVTSIPKLRFDLVSITDLSEKGKDSIVDVVGICKEASPVTKIVARSTGNELTKREVTIVDQSNASIVLTLWGNDAESFNDFDNPVILLKGVKLGEYAGGKTLAITSSSVMKVNPDIPEGHQLRGWFENGGMNKEFVGLSTRTGTGNMSAEWITFHESKLRNIGSEKTDYFQTSGMVHSIRSENMIYKACANSDCNKKLIETESGTYRCEKCNVESPNFKNRLLVSMLIGDWTSNRWVTFFSELGEKIIGKSTDEMANLLENSKSEADAVIQDALFKPMIFKFRSKVETYGDIPRNKITGLAVNETKVKDYNQHLMKNIRRLTGIDKAEKMEH